MASQQALLTNELSLQIQEPPFLRTRLELGITSLLILGEEKKMEEGFLPEKLLGAHSIFINILENLSKNPNLLSLKSA